MTTRKTPDLGKIDRALRLADAPIHACTKISYSRTSSHVDIKFNLRTILQAMFVNGAYTDFYNLYKMLIQSRITC